MVHIPMPFKSVLVHPSTLQVFIHYILSYIPLICDIIFLMKRPLENDYRLNNLGERISGECIRKALSDPEFFMANYQQIVNKERQTVPFVLNTFQRMFFSLIVPKITKATRLNKRHSIVICKGRQQGASVSTVALINYICALLDGIQNMVILHAFPVGQTISKFYTRKVQPIITGVHPNLFPTIYKENLGSSIITTYKDIKGVRRNNIYELVSANASSIRSDSVHIVVLDECSFYKRPYELEAAIAPAIPDTGFSLVIYISTFDDKNDFFKQKIETARDNPEDWTLVFSPWFMTYPENSYGIDYRDISLTEYDNEVLIPALSSAGISSDAWGDKITWYNKRFVELGRVNMLKEYPTTIDEVLTYGEDRAVFNKESLDKQKENLLVGKCYRVVTDNQTKKVEAQETDISPFKIYKNPLYGHRYRVSIDPITARSDDTDNFAMHVMDLATHEQVAVFKERGLTDEDYADWAISIGTIYNNAELCPEINVANGFVVAVNARRYYHWYYEDKKNRADRIPGIRTTVASKERMIDNLNSMLDRGAITIHDEDTLDELRNMVKKIKVRSDGSRTVKREAKKGHHDDLVAALFIYAGSLTQTQIEGRTRSNWTIL